MTMNSIYPLDPSGKHIQKAIENGHLQGVVPLKMVMFHSYISLPEGSMNTVCMIFSEAHIIFYINGRMNIRLKTASEP